MANPVRTAFLQQLGKRFSPITKMGGSNSLFELAAGQAVVYVRYSRLHRGQTAFYGLRDHDLRRMAGINAFIVFLWDTQVEPVFVPLDEFWEVFAETGPAGDGQYKVQVSPRPGGTEMYIARAGRFNVEADVGWETISDAIPPQPSPVPSLGHAQVQTLLGAIGHTRGLDVWLPPGDRGALDWSLAKPFECRADLTGYDAVWPILREIDVIWIRRSGNAIEALYEVEHSTPVYSGLLRFNDVRLSVPGSYRLAIAAENDRRSLFVRRLNRPTFRASNLTNICQFISYPEVYRWHERIARTP